MTRLNNIITYIIVTKLNTYNNLAQLLSRTIVGKIYFELNSFYTLIVKMLARKRYFYLLNTNYYYISH